MYCHGKNNRFHGVEVKIPIIYFQFATEIMSLVSFCPELLLLQLLVLKCLCLAILLQLGKHDFVYLDIMSGT